MGNEWYRDALGTKRGAISEQPGCDCVQRPSYSQSAPFKDEPGLVNNSRSGARRDDLPGI
jgi:hypothetical protein